MSHVAKGDNRNRGGGAAHSLLRCGRLYWQTEGVTVEFVPTSLAAGKTEDILLEWRDTPDRGPNQSHGVIDYEDIALGRWQTRFWVDDVGHFTVKEVQWMMRPDGSVPAGNDAYPYTHPE